MGDRVLGIHGLGESRKREREKWISVCKNVSFGRWWLASKGSFVKLIYFTESWKRGMLSSEACEPGCLLTSPSVFIHSPSARNPPSCSPSDEKCRDVSQPTSLFQAGFPCWLQVTSWGWGRTGQRGCSWQERLGRVEGKVSQPLSSSAGQLYVEAMHLHSTDPIKSRSAEKEGFLCR